MSAAPIRPDHEIREELLRLYGQHAAAAFDRMLLAGLPCELCGRPDAAILRYPDGVALCERCDGEGIGLLPYDYKRGDKTLDFTPEPE